MPVSGLVHPQGCEPRRRREERGKPAPDGCVLVAIADKAHTSNFRVDVPFTWGWIPNTQIP